MMTQAALTKLQGEAKPKTIPCCSYSVCPCYASGTKQWIQRLVQNGKRIDRGLGAFPFVGIEEAKRLAREQHAGVKVGNQYLPRNRERLSRSNKPMKSM